jgi:hypothetical protein
MSWGKDVHREIISYAMEVKRMGNNTKYQELQDQMFKALADKKINQGTCANVNKLLILAEIRKIEAPKELQIDGKAVSVIWRSDIHCSVYAKTSLAAIQRALEIASTLL